MMENDCTPGDEIFTNDLRIRLVFVVIYFCKKQKGERVWRKI